MGLFSRVDCGEIVHVSAVLLPNYRYIPWCGMLGDSKGLLCREDCWQIVWFYSVG